MPFKPKQFGASKRQAERRQRERQRGSATARGYGGKGWEHTRRAVFLRDLYRCQGQGCGVLVGQRPRDAHCDHIIPKDKGGTDDMSNLETLCEECHARKTRRGD